MCIRLFPVIVLVPDRYNTQKSILFGPALLELMLIGQTPKWTGCYVGQFSSRARKFASAPAGLEASLQLKPCCRRRLRYICAFYFQFISSLTCNILKGKYETSFFSPKHACVNWSSETDCSSLFTISPLIKAYYNNTNNNSYWHLALNETFVDLVLILVKLNKNPKTYQSNWEISTVRKNITVLGNDTSISPPRMSVSIGKIDRCLRESPTWIDCQ